MTALAHPILHPDHLSAGLIFPTSRKRAACFAYARNSGLERFPALARPSIRTGFAGDLSDWREARTLALSFGDAFRATFIANDNSRVRFQIGDHVCQDLADLPENHHPLLSSAALCGCDHSERHLTHGTKALSPEGKSRD